MRAAEFVVEYKKYPTEEYQGLTMSMIEKDGQLIVRAIDDWGVNELGYVIFNIGDNDELDPQDLRVEDRYQGQGIARVMYDYVTSHGYEIHRSWDQTPAGAGFWNKHRGEDVRVWEDVNPDIYHSNFNHQQEIGDYLYTAKTDNNSGYGNQLIIKVYDGRKEIGFVEFVEEPEDKVLISGNTWVHKNYREQGIATNMYAYAKMLGNDIIPSWDQTDQGERMWRSWNQSKQSKHILPKGHKGYNEINESRDSLFSWLKQHFPAWPDYVVKDFLYPQAKGIRDRAELEDFLKRNKQDFGQVKWKLEKLPITLDIFTPKTQRMIKSRAGGSSNPFSVPRDAERHAQQLKMIRQQGVRTEPIIVAKLDNGYDLIEGWHRTIQHLQAYPQGYTGPAWVGYGATYQSN